MGHVLQQSHRSVASVNISPYGELPLFVSFRIS